jgi:hypothetical protein
MHSIHDIVHEDELASLLPAKKERRTRPCKPPSAALSRMLSNSAQVPKLFTITLNKRVSEVLALEADLPRIAELIQPIMVRVALSRPLPPRLASSRPVALNVIEERSRDTSAVDDCDLRAQRLSQPHHLHKFLRDGIRDARVVQFQNAQMIGLSDEAAETRIG